MDRKASIKSITADTVTIAGYGVVFGGSDLDGETFTKDTDYMLDLVPNKLTLYDHGMNQAIKTSVIGRIPADNIKVDEFGLWIEAELARSNEYTAYIMALAEKGVLGWSSGSVSHLVERSGKTIKSWPIIEFSLTPTPAEPRTLGAEVMKSLAEFDAGSVYYKSCFEIIAPIGNHIILRNDALCILCCKRFWKNRHLHIRI